MPCGPMDPPRPLIHPIDVDFFNASFVRLRGYLDERMRQAKISFNVAIIMSIVGICVIIAGVILLYIGKINGGILSSGVGALSETASIFLFRANKQSNNRLDAVRKDIYRMDTIALSLEAVKHIPEGEERNKAIASIIQGLKNLKG